MDQSTYTCYRLRHVMRVRIKLVPCHGEDGAHEGLAGSLKVHKQCHVIVSSWSGLVDDMEENLSCFRAP